MASIIMSGDVPSEVRKMINDFMKGKISITRLFEFLNNNGFEVKISESKNSECKNDENNEKENYAKDTINFVKQFIENYDNDNDEEKDDIDQHIKAVKLCNSLLDLVIKYRKRANDGVNSYDIPKFNLENILDFIDSIDLPTDKIRKSFEKRKSFCYKNKIYNDFNDFESSMKNAYGIEDVWNPPKETPEWFKSLRDRLYAKFNPEEFLEEVDEDEWNEFKKWKEKKSSTSKKTTSSVSVKKGKTTTKKPSAKSKTGTKKISSKSTDKKSSTSVSVKKGKTTTKKTSKTDTETKLKEFKEYADYILLNSHVEDNARDLLLLYAANMDERCKKLYNYLIDLKKRKKSVKLIKYHDELFDTENLVFEEL